MMENNQLQGWYKEMFDLDTKRYQDKFMGLKPWDVHNIVDKQEMHQRRSVQKMRSITTDSGFVGVAYKELRKTGMLPFSGNNNRGEQSKCAARSSTYRSKGNLAFISSPPELTQAHVWYNKCITSAPYPVKDNLVSSELALGLANRSAVLFAMEKYEECLGDIKQALKYKYPDKLKHKLFTRRADCCKVMGKMVEAKMSVESALEYVPYAAVENEVKEKLMTTLRHKLKALAKVKKCSYKPSTVLRPPPVKTYGDNREIPCASKCMEIAFSPEWGRHFKANQDIKPGKILIIETPYVSVLQKEWYSLYCYNCFKRYDAMLPCKTCALVMYCSNACRNTSWVKSHQIECPILRPLIALEDNMLMLVALRIFTTALNTHNGLPGLFQHVRNIEQDNKMSDERTKGFNESGQYISSEYVSLHHLSRAYERPIEDIHMYAMQAAKLLNCLQVYSDLFKGDGRNYDSFVGGLLVRYMLLFTINGSTITDYGPPTRAKLVILPPVIGYGLYPTSSLLNHSCVPNVCIHLRGDTMVIMSCQKIMKGEQLYADYIGNTRAGTSDRQAILKSHFYFTCTCEDCNGKLPKLLSSHNFTYRCSNCLEGLPTHSTKCIYCNNVTNIKQAANTIAIAIGRLDYLDETVRSEDKTSEIGALFEVLQSNIVMSRLSIHAGADQLRFNSAQAGNFFLTRGSLE